MPEAESAGLSADAVIRELWKPGGTESDGVYAVLDCARDPRVFPSMAASGLHYECLFSGKLPRVLAMAAPYLVELLPDAGYTRNLINDGFGKAWGIFASSGIGMEELRKHFKTFLKVKDKSTGRSLYFRFFDPRVLRVYLPTCNSYELKHVLDPLAFCFAENEDGRKLLRYCVEYPVNRGGEGLLRTKRIPVAGNAG